LILCPAQIEEPPPLKFLTPNMSSIERQEFLNADYTIEQKVADLPTGMRQLYTVKRGSRIASADPGEKFEATDVIADPDLPSRRLIFAGVAQDRAFIHYEQGGTAHFMRSNFFAWGRQKQLWVFGAAIAVLPRVSQNCGNLQNTATKYRFR
jgi:hypothetical protein